MLGTPRLRKDPGVGSFAAGATERASARLRRTGAGRCLSWLDAFERPRDSCPMSSWGGYPGSGTTAWQEERLRGVRGKGQVGREGF